MKLKIKDGIIAKCICTVIERKLQKKYGINPVIFLDEFSITESEEVGVSHIVLKAEANIDTKDLNNIILSTVK